MTFEKYDFSCPKCNFLLETNNLIELDVKRNNGDEAKIYLSKTIGRYDYVMRPQLKLDKGELLDFDCPSCNSRLNSDEHEGFAALKMIAEHKFEFEVLFSRESGVQRTYIVTEDGMECYGRDCGVHS
jgi:hypothetical protein